MRSVKISSLVTAARHAQQFSEPTLLLLDLACAPRNLLTPASSFTLPVLLLFVKQIFFPFLFSLLYMLTHTYCTLGLLECY